MESAFHRAKNNALTSPVLRQNEMSTVFMEGFSRVEICVQRGRKAFNFTISFRTCFQRLSFLEELSRHGLWLAIRKRRAKGEKREN